MLVDKNRLETHKANPLGGFGRSANEQRLFSLPSQEAVTEDTTGC